MAVALRGDPVRRNRPGRPASADLLWHAADRYLHLLIGDRDRAPDENSIKEHRHLLDPAVAGNTDALHAAWVEHLDSSEKALAEVLAKRPEA